MLHKKQPGHIASYCLAQYFTQSEALGNGPWDMQWSVDATFENAFSPGEQGLHLLHYFSLTLTCTGSGRGGKGDVEMPSLALQGKQHLNMHGDSLLLETREKTDVFCKWVSLFKEKECLFQAFEEVDIYFKEKC